MSAPLLTDALPGFRAWSLEPASGELYPATGALGPWPTGVVSARCARGATHLAPAADCSCGLYAFHTVHRQLAHESVVGAIAAWGDMEVHRDGFRAQHATVLALAADQRSKGIGRAADRYGVPVVPRRWLQPMAALMTGALPLSLVAVEPAAAAHWLSRRRGYAAADQMWVEPAGGMVTLGISPALRRWLGDDVAVTDALELRGRDGSVQLPAQVRGRVVELNRDPRPAGVDEEGGCWIARVAPSRWEQDLRRFTWGPAGRAELLAEAALGPDAWEHLVPGRTATGISSWREARDLLRALDVAPEPRFASAAELYDEVAIPLGRALPRDPAMGRLRVVLGVTLTSPAARLVFDLGPGGPSLHVEHGPSGELEVTLSADDFLALIDGRLDLARESRTGRLRVRGSLAHALSCLAILSSWARPHLAELLSSSRPRTRSAAAA